MQNMSVEVDFYQLPTRPSFFHKQSTVRVPDDGRTSKNDVVLSRPVSAAKDVLFGYRMRCAH